MRFVFVDPEALRENALREARLGALDALFRAYDGRASRPVVEARLRELEPGLEPEWIDGDEPARAALAFDLREPSLAPLVRASAARNRELPGLAIHAERPRAPLDAALADVKRVTGFDLGRARFRAGFGRGHLLDVVIHATDFGSGVDPAALAAAERLVLRILGERTRTQWVGAVAAAALPRGTLPMLGANDAARTLPMAELLPSVEAAIAGLYAGLSDRPLARLDASDDWVMFEIEPENAGDPARKNDLVLASTRAPELTKAFLEGMPFSSLRFSRHGEVFCYLKTRATERTAAEQHAALTALEDALGGALRREGLGAVIGSGLGVRHSYVDLALVAVEPAVEVVRRFAAERLPRDTWLLFCDSEWSQEWIGLVPRGRPPPGVEPP